MRPSAAEARLRDALDAKTGGGEQAAANEHHQQMFAALRNRDAEAVRAAVRADIDAAFDVLVDLLK
ncbi:FCD domain-containing protein [Mesorhizobium sp. M0621]|uniref:FCD domain-containing protein n=1 Tax=Mesorhizobium sp. M0621 TaxID=2956974 RepID=UPI00333CBDC5